MLAVLRSSTVLLLLAALAGCSATALQRDRFQEFALVGIEYSQALEEFLGAAGETYVEVDSQMLLRNRALAGELPPAQADSARILLEEELERSDADLRTLLRELDLIRRHGWELAAYFKALADLAAADVAKPLVDEVRGIFAAVDTLSGRIRQGRLIARPAAAERAGAEVASFVVERVRVAELNQELRRRQETIAKELLLHEALLDVLAADLAEIRRRQAGWAYDADVLEPFLSSSVLQTGPGQIAWTHRRTELLLAASLPGELESAARLAGNLRSAWSRLLSDRLGLEEIEALLQEAAAMMNVVSLVREGFFPAPPPVQEEP